MSLEAQVSTLSELVGVLNALLEKALNAMISSVSNATGTIAPPSPVTGAAQGPAPGSIIDASTASVAIGTTPKSRGRPRAVAAVVVAPTAAPADSVLGAGIPATTFKDVENAIVALAKVKGRNRAEAVLGDLGVTKCGELKATDYDKAIDAFNKAAKAA